LYPLNKVVSSIPVPSNPIQNPPKVVTPTIVIPNQNRPNPSEPALTELYNYALKIVNDDRKANGLNPVALSNINSAQDHADDQLSNDYFSHWNSNGVKPYVTYTKLGGMGSVAENNDYSYSTCPTNNCLPNNYDPYEQIKKAEDDMMNNEEVCIPCTWS